MMARKVTTIPATINKLTAAPIASHVKRKSAFPSAASSAMTGEKMAIWSS